jgi:hypothetical protein
MISSNYLKITLLMCITLLFGVSNAFSQVLFQDDFESYSSSWACTSGQLSKWTSGYMYCGSTSSFGAEWKMGEGRNGGKAVYSWKSSQVPNGYRSESMKWMDTPAAEVYHRWYMKMPSNLDKSIAEGFKLWRYILRENGFSNPPEIYLNIHGSTVKSGSLCIYNGTTGYRDLIPVSAFNDGQWHSHELRLKVNNAGSNDGVIQYWLDGVLKATYNNVSFNPSVSGMKIHRVGVGIGNTSDSAWYMSSWTGVGFDDIVVSTSYVGLSGSATPAPAPSPTPTADTTKPTVSISSPANSQTVSGTTNASANASDNVGVVGVQFKINESNQGSEDTTAPYSLSWNTTTYQNGTYTLTAVARDAAGNSTTSSPVQVTVNNGTTSGTVLFEEKFEDSNFSGRGWYDNAALALSSTEKITGSTKSAQFSFTKGGTKPTSGGAIRKQFVETDSVHVSYWIKYSSNWKEQAGNYGHHEIYLLTNQNDAWSSLSFNRLTAYLEAWGTSGQLTNLTPHVTFQDGQNIDQSKLNVNLTQTTEYRAVNGCNGSLDPFQTTCYNAGNGTYVNGKYLSGGAGSMALGQWHRVEAYIKLNSIVNSKAVADGTVAYWLNGQQIFRHDNVLIRTGQFPNMKFNQFVIAPFMGNGAPDNQSFWIDDLKVATSSSSAPSTTPPTAPTNLRIVSMQ